MTTETAEIAELRVLLKVAYHDWPYGENHMTMEEWNKRTEKILKVNP